MAGRIGFQLELMRQAANRSTDPVVRESFQKLQDFLCETGGLRDVVLKIIEDSILFADAAPPGLRFTRANAVNSTNSTYLQVGNIPSNVTGAPIHVTGDVTKIVVEASETSTFKLQFQQKTIAGILINIHEVSISGDDRAVFSVDDATLPTGLLVGEGNQMAVFCSSGNTKNVVTDVILGAAA